MDKIARFRALHERCFVMPNAWDPGTARYVQQLGFSALASTSAGFAFSRGLPDAGVPLALMLEHLRELVNATELPVSADFQSGYAEDLPALAANVQACVATGVAGLSIEDLAGNARDLYPVQQAAERVRAARAAIDATGVPVVLTARCEAFLVQHPAPLSEAAARLALFAEAGADCLFAPGVSSFAEIEVLVRAVAPRPLNVLAGTPSSTVADLRDAGVRRISLGSSAARVAWGAFAGFLREIDAHGTFEAGATALPYAELNALFMRG